MNLAKLAAIRAEEGNPVRAGLIGAGKFGSMFLGQVPSIPGLEVTAIADIDPMRARQACGTVGWSEDRTSAVAILDNGDALAERDDVKDKIWNPR